MRLSFLPKFKTYQWSPPLKSTDEVTCDKNCEKEEGLEGGLLQPSCVEPHASGGQGFVDKEVGPG